LAELERAICLIVRVATSRGRFRDPLRATV